MNYAEGRFVEGRWEGGRENGQALDLHSLEFIWWVGSDVLECTKDVFRYRWRLRKQIARWLIALKLQNQVHLWGRSQVTSIDLKLCSKSFYTFHNLQTKPKDFSNAKASHATFRLAHFM